MPGRLNSLAEEAAKMRQQTEGYSEMVRPRTQDDPLPTVGLVPRDDPGGVVYRCFFDQRTDPNQDGWPDGWTRKSGLEFPEHITTEIVRSETPVNLQVT